MTQPFDQSSSPAQPSIDLKIYRNALNALIDRFSNFRDELSAAVAEQTSSLLAAGLNSRASSKESLNGVDEKEAFLESSIRWLYTGRS